MAQPAPDVAPTRRPLAIVTGASEGLGRALAALYAADGFDVVLVARRETLLAALAAELATRFGVEARPVPCDLASREACARLVQALEPERGRVAALVNNAGLGSLGRFVETPLDRELQQVDVNVTALTALTRGILPWLVANGRGHVMNIASVAGFQPGPLMAVYYATKAYVLSLSEALSVEVAGTGVTVTAVCPGPVPTGFQRVSGAPTGAAPGGAPSMDAGRVARIAYDGTRAGRRVVIPGFRNRIAAFLGRHLPRAITSTAVRRIQEGRLATARAPDG
jgi:uncharacterized protein